MPVRQAVYYISVLAFFGLIFFFFTVEKGGFFYANSASMEPTIQAGDRMVIVKSEAPMRGDIIVFKNPQEPERFLVKRLIGLPGDEVGIYHNLILNGKPVQEPYLKEKEMVYTYGPVKVPEKNLFVLGDNRNDSDDSSVWGFLPEENLRGKVIFRYWPPKRAGRMVSQSPIPSAVARP